LTHSKGLGFEKTTKRFSLGLFVHLLEFLQKVVLVLHLSSFLLLSAAVDGSSERPK
jgi:hypothetical protein